MNSPSKKPRHVLAFFRITFECGSDTYTVIPLSPDPGIAKKAFRLRKQTGDRQVYDVCLTAHGPECDCKGFLYRRRCKHIRMLTAAGMLDGKEERRA
jgi:hypothetical protein